MPERAGHAVVEQVARGMIRMRLQGRESVTLKLHPPSLGEVRLQVHVHLHQVRTEVVTETAAARDLLAGQVHLLRQALADQGLRLDRIVVHWNQDPAAGGFGSPGQAFRDPHGQDTSRGYPSAPAAEEPALAEVPVSGVVLDRGRVSLFV